MNERSPPCFFFRAQTANIAIVGDSGCPAVYLVYSTVNRLYAHELIIEIVVHALKGFMRI
jgi:hypothetical protein